MKKASELRKGDSIKAIVDDNYDGDIFIVKDNVYEITYFTPDGIWIFNEQGEEMLYPFIPQNQETQLPFAHYFTWGINFETVKKDDYLIHIQGDFNFGSITVGKRYKVVSSNQLSIGIIDNVGNVQYFMFNIGGYNSAERYFQLESTIEKRHADIEVMETLFKALQGLNDHTFCDKMNTVLIDWKAANKLSSNIKNILYS